eukprot:1130217-Pyramimonas_sp.AAC.1
MQHHGASALSTVNVEFRRQALRGSTGNEPAECSAVSVDPVASSVSSANVGRNILNDGYGSYVHGKLVFDEARRPLRQSDDNGS